MAIPAVVDRNSGRASRSTRAWNIFIFPVSIAKTISEGAEMAKRKACIDCKKRIPQPEGRGRPRLRCTECAWLAAKQQKRAYVMREYAGVPADEAREAALWYYGPPSRD